MTKDTKDWLLVYLIPYAAIGLPTLGMGLLLPVAGFGGIAIGLFSTHPYYSVDFKLLFGLSLLFCVILFCIGYKFRVYVWGKILNALGFYLLCFVGIIGLGPA